MIKSYEDVFIRQGVDRAEARLISDAIALGTAKRSGSSFYDSENYGVRAIRRAYSGGDRAKDFRALQKRQVAELLQVPTERFAFGDLPDQIREMNSAFYYEMHGGNQARFLDRKQDETPEEFLDRPGKVTFNVTQLVISVLSRLYARAPTRKLADLTAPHIEARLSEIWTSKSFNLSLLDADRFTRLCGVVAIRPMYDPTVKGRIRLWLFMNHQLRVIPDPERPWCAAAVIERQQPFGDGAVTIWTDKHFVVVRGRAVRGVEHGFGRIPHVFCKDTRSYTAFFPEGRGRLLADPNAVLNNDLSDLNEVKQMQGFATLQVVNSDEDDIRVGPRQLFRFTVKDSERPFGAEYKKPDAPIRELAEDCDRTFRRILVTNNVPPAAIAAAIDERQLSGEAIRTAMQPLVEDQEERSRIFEPIEQDLADSMLRVIRRHEASFTYDPDLHRPDFGVKYAGYSFPASVRDRTLRDDWEVAQGVSTPAQIMRRDNPDDYPDPESAVAAWKANLAEMSEAGFVPARNTDELRASFMEGLEDPGSNLPGEEDAEPLTTADVLDLAMSAGLLNGLA